MVSELYGGVKRKGHMEVHLKPFSRPTNQLIRSYTKCEG